MKVIRLHGTMSSERDYRPESANWAKPKTDSLWPCDQKNSILAMATKKKLIPKTTRLSSSASSQVKIYTNPKTLFIFVI